MACDCSSCTRHLARPAAQLRPLARPRCPGNQLWTESDSANDPGFAGTCHEMTFYGAKALCELMGARLCTKSEVESGCATGTGCHFNAELIWTSSTGSIRRMPLF